MASRRFLSLSSAALAVAAPWAAIPAIHPCDEAIVRRRRALRQLTLTLTGMRPYRKFRKLVEARLR